MAKFKMELVRAECTACESCVESCPDYFEMADDALVNLKGLTKAGDNEELAVDTLACIKDDAFIAFPYRDYWFCSDDGDFLQVRDQQ
jgi:ferredoxin